MTVPILVRPIASAPRDRTIVLVRFNPTSGEFTVANGRWNHDSYSKRPRPFWDFGNNRPMADSARPPQFWIDLDEVATHVVEQLPRSTERSDA